MKIKALSTGIKMFVGILLFLFIFCEGLFGQSDIVDLNSNTYEEKTSQGIVAVEYWAGWNKINRVVDFDKAKSAELYRVNIDSCLDLQIKNSVIVVPTIIFYDNGKEYKRLQGDLSFTLAVSKKELQKIIDEILMSKF